MLLQLINILFHYYKVVAASEERDHGKISIKTYYQYLTSGHCGHIFTAIVALIFIVTEV